MRTHRHQCLAVSLLRFGLGINIFLHGAIRFFDYQKFVGNTVSLFSDSLLPAPLVELFVRLIPFIETGIGFFVIFGLFAIWSLTAGLLMMIALMIGMCTLQKWDIVSLQLNYVVIYAICIFLVDKDFFSLDQLFASKQVAK